MSGVGEFDKKQGVGVDFTLTTKCKNCGEFLIWIMVQQKSMTAAQLNTTQDGHTIIVYVPKCGCRVAS